MRLDLDGLAAASREALMAEWREVVGRPPPQAFKQAPDGADFEPRLSSGYGWSIYQAFGWSPEESRPARCCAPCLQTRQPLCAPVSRDHPCS